MFFFPALCERIVLGGLGLGKGEFKVMGADLVAMELATFYSGKNAVRFAKICRFV
jgi:hypothetical protein